MLLVVKDKRLPVIADSFFVVWGLFQLNWFGDEVAEVNFAG